MNEEIFDLAEDVQSFMLDDKYCALCGETMIRTYEFKEQ